MFANSKDRRAYNIIITRKMNNYIRFAEYKLPLQIVPIVAVYYLDLD